MILNPYIYKVLAVNKVVDGDTIDLTIDLGFGITKSDRYRLTDIDTPETFRPKNKAEYDAGILCKNFLSQKVLDNIETLHIETTKIPEIYGRYGGTLFYNGGQDLNEEIQKFMVENHITKIDLGV